MNLQGFPRDFLLKLKPEVEHAETDRLVFAMSGRTLSNSAAGLLTVSPRCTEEPGVVEIAVRLKLSAGPAFVSEHHQDLQPVSTPVR